MFLIIREFCFVCWDILFIVSLRLRIWIMRREWCRSCMVRRWIFICVVIIFLMILMNWRFVLRCCFGLWFFMSSMFVSGWRWLIWLSWVMWFWGRNNNINMLKLRNVWVCLCFFCFLLIFCILMLRLVSLLIWLCLRRCWWILFCWRVVFCFIWFLLVWLLVLLLMVLLFFWLLFCFIRCLRVLVLVLELLLFFISRVVLGFGCWCLFLVVFV